MYAIATVMYGIPLCSETKSQSQLSADLMEVIEDGGDEAGFHISYRGSGGDVPAAFGIELDSFDEACALVEVSDLKLEPTKKQIDEFNKMFNSLDENMQKEITKFGGKPRVFFLWESS